ncbi:hypothetical protein IQ06DRAFT_94582 [Phaeosphaeriaceae sp. SRC1lsM3a]|nr:hypothetical protein IQ06DRAFT_94582 [Stagonospora sp. SRC1lsM3a]
MARRFPAITPALWVPKTLVAHQYHPRSLFTTSPAFCFFLLITHVQPPSSDSNPTPISPECSRPEAAIKSRRPIVYGRNMNQWLLRQRINLEAEVRSNGGFPSYIRSDILLNSLSRATAIWQHYRSVPSRSRLRAHPERHNWPGSARPPFMTRMRRSGGTSASGMS